MFYHYNLKVSFLETDNRIHKTIDQAESITQLLLIIILNIIAILIFISIIRNAWLVYKQKIRHENIVLLQQEVV